MEPLKLSARQRQLMDIAYRRGEATVLDFQKDLSDPPSASAIRTMLMRLEQRGWLVHRYERGKSIYSPTTSRERARESAVQRLVDTFFSGSPLQAVQGILDGASTRLTEAEFEELQALIDEAKRRQ